MSYDGEIKFSVELDSSKFETSVAKLGSIFEKLDFTNGSEAVLKTIDGIKNATESMKSIIESVGINISRSFKKMADSTTPFEKGLSNVSNAMNIFGNIDAVGQYIDKLRKYFSTTGKSADVFSTVLSAIQEPMLCITDGSEKVAGQISGVSKNFTIASDSGNHFEGMMKNVAGSIGDVASSAQGAGGAMSGIPFDAISLGVSAVLIVIQLLIQAFNVVDEETQGLIDSSQQLQDSIRETEAAYQQSKAEMIAQADIAEGIINSYKGVDRNAKEVAKSNDTLAEAVAKLNSVMPDLNLAIDENGKILDTNTGLIYDDITAIYDRIDVLELEAQAEAKKQLLIDKYKRLSEVQGQTSQNMEKLKELCAEVGISFEDAAKGTLSYTDLLKLSSFTNLEASNGIRKLSNETENLIEEESNLTGEINTLVDGMNTEAMTAHENADAKGEMAEANAAVAEAEQALTQTMTEEAEKRNMLLDAYNAKVAEYAAVKGMAYDTVEQREAAHSAFIADMAAHEQAVLDGLNSTYENYASVATNAFDTVTQNSTISIDQMIQNLKDNQQAMADWSTNLDTLAGLGLTGLVSQLEAGGVATGDQAQRIVDELTELNGGVDISLGAVTDAARAKLEEFGMTMDSGVDDALTRAETQMSRDSFVNSGDKAFVQVGDGIARNNAVIEQSKNKMDAVAQEVETASADPRLTTSGSAMVDTIAAGEASNNNLNVQTRQTMESAKDAANQHAQSSAWNNVGMFAMSGVARGINAGSGIVMSTVTRVMNDAVRTAKAAIDSNSPSKLFAREVGEPISQGVAVGIGNAAGDVDDALVGVIRGAKNMMQGMAQGFASEETNLYKKVDELTGGLLTNMRKIPKGMAKGWMDEMRMEIQNFHARMDNMFRAQAMTYVMKQTGTFENAQETRDAHKAGLEQNKLLAEQNELLRKLNDKQLTAKVSSRGIAIAAEEGRSAMGAKISKGAFSNAY